MTLFKTRHALKLCSGALVLAGVASFAPPRLHARQALELSTMEMLDLYERRREIAMTGFGDQLHSDSVYSDISRDGKKWIMAAGPDQVERRRLVLAAFALEVIQRLAPDREQSQAEQDVRALAQGAATPKGGGSGALPTGGSAANADTEWGVGMRLIGFVRDRLLEQRTPAPLEMSWHLALIGLMEYYATREGGAPNGAIMIDLTTELEYVRDRYPKDPRFFLIWAWKDYYTYRVPGMLWPEKMDRDHIWDTWEIPFLTSAEDYYSSALANPATSAEAKVRIGEMRLKRNDADGALKILQEADQESRDKEVRYLSSLEQGWAYEMKADHPHAIAAFSRALAFLPDAQTASIGLAGALMLEGRIDDAASATDAGLTHDVLDPWIFHRYPAYEHFSEIMDKIRDELK